MATEILIPKLGMTMTEGTVAEWYIPDNGEVKQGEHVYPLISVKMAQNPGNCFLIPQPQNGVDRKNCPNMIKIVSSPRRNQ
jgi:hypothetical protein